MPTDDVVGNAVTIIDDVLLDIASEHGSELADLLYPEVALQVVADVDSQFRTAVVAAVSRMPDAWAVVGLTHLNDYDGCVERRVTL